MLLVHTTGMMNVGIDLSDVIKVTRDSIRCDKTRFCFNRTDEEHAIKF